MFKQKIAMLSASVVLSSIFAAIPNAAFAYLPPLDPSWPPSPGVLPEGYEECLNEAGEWDNENCSTDPFLADQQLQETADWKVAPAAFKAADEDLNPKVILTEAGDEQTIWLRNRGMAISKASYPNGVDFKAKWQYTHGLDEGALQDVLVVGLRSNGKQREKWSHEMQSGIMVRFQAIGENHEVGIFTVTEGMATLKVKKDVEIARGIVYDIHIVDTGRKFTVKFGDNCVLEVDDFPEPQSGDPAKVIVYNREPSSGVFQQSHVDKVKIKAYTPEEGSSSSEEEMPCGSSSSSAASSEESSASSAASSEGASLSADSSLIGYAAPSEPTFLDKVFEWLQSWFA